jgi:ATP synthase alpha/beta subunit-like protein
MVELLKQQQYVPYNPIDQCISIFADTMGFLGNVEVRHALAEAKSFKGLEDQFSETVKQFQEHLAAAPGRGPHQEGLSPPPIWRATAGVRPIGLQARRKVVAWGAGAAQLPPIPPSAARR